MFLRSQSNIKAIIPKYLYMLHISCMSDSYVRVLKEKMKAEKLIDYEVKIKQLLK